MQKKAILWDWNGTLLNDIRVCVECMNHLLTKRKLDLLDEKRYREIFTFPVKEYYQKAGFDFSLEDFEIPAMEFIHLYQEHLTEAALFPCADNVLQQLKNRNFYQAVLSAMEHESLVSSLKDTGVYSYFDRVTGINDHYAHSKLEVGERLLKSLSFEKEEILLVGDSLHDLEVARALEVDCVLVSNGHQSKERLLEKTTCVVDELAGMMDFL